MGVESLQEIYDQCVKVNDLKQKSYNKIADEVIEFIVGGMRKSDELFDKLYRKIYKTGSRWDGLQVGTERQEFDICKGGRQLGQIQMVKGAPSVECKRSFYVNAWT